MGSVKVNLFISPKSKSFYRDWGASAYNAPINANNTICNPNTGVIRLSITLK